jgi:death-on-curing protein
MPAVDYLSAEDILLIHSVLIDETGGSHGVRDRHAIMTLEELPRQVVFGKELYPTLFVKAALYVRNIISAHPFVDGNKRTAMAAADVFLQKNGFRISVRKGGVETFALSVIAEKKDLEKIAVWLEKNTKRAK